MCLWNSYFNLKDTDNQSVWAINFGVAGTCSTIPSVSYFKLTTKHTHTQTHTVGGLEKMMLSKCVEGGSVLVTINE